MKQILKERLDELEDQHSEAMVLLLNLAGVYLYVNSRSTAVLGYESREVIGRHALEFAAPEDVPHVELTLQDAILNGESITVSIRVRTKSSELKPVRGSVASFDDPDTGEVYLIGWVAQI
ncbi:MAG: hypothetical protein JWN01_517 [Patescibacteria group bacterium]|nr:hypothetical protein [Patescibacteria group bacterium]